MQDNYEIVEKDGKRFVVFATYNEDYEGEFFALEVQEASQDLVDLYFEKLYR